MCISSGPEPAGLDSTGRRGDANRPPLGEDAPQAASSIGLRHRRSRYPSRKPHSENLAVRCGIAGRLPTPRESHNSRFLNETNRRPAPRTRGTRRQSQRSRSGTAGSASGKASGYPESGAECGGVPEPTSQLRSYLQLAEVKRKPAYRQAADGVPESGHLRFCPQNRALFDLHHPCGVGRHRCHDPRAEGGFFDRRSGGHAIPGSQVSLRGRKSCNGELKTFEHRA